MLKEMCQGVRGWCFCSSCQPTALHIPTRDQHRWKTIPAHPTIKLKERHSCQCRNENIRENCHSNICTGHETFITARCHHGHLPAATEGKLPRRELWLQLHKSSHKVLDSCSYPNEQLLMPSSSEFQIN